MVGMPVPRKAFASALELLGRDLAHPHPDRIGHQDQLRGAGRGQERRKQQQDEDGAHVGMQ